MRGSCLVLLVFMLIVSWFWFGWLAWCVIFRLVCCVNRFDGDDSLC